MNAFSQWTRWVARQAGYGLTKCDRGHGYPVDFSDWDVEVIEAVKAYTMTTPERLVGLLQAVRYVVANGIAGDMVECGVWKGGSMMAVAMELVKLGVDDRELYLCDTFEGMVAPTEHDVSRQGTRAADKFANRRTVDGAGSDWHSAGVREVKDAMETSGYPPARMHYVEGKVEDTLPAGAPETISILRLDTDWYESTKHELEVLYPRLPVGGVLIIDDFGDWQGARKAVEEYFETTGQPMFLSRMDHSARIGVKVAAP